MCHRKIKTNIGDNKPDFLCSQHSKIHTPKKRVKKVEIPTSFEKKKKDIKKIKKRKVKKVYIYSGGILNFTDVINKITK